MLARPQSQQAWHGLLAVNTKESMAWKGQFDTRYAAIRTWLHEMGGLKQYVTFCAEHVLQGGISEGFSDGVNNIHPRAVVFIAKHGEEYTGVSWDADGAEPDKGACFGNARIQQLILNNRARADGLPERMLYVEGVALGAWSNPVHHAWNALTKYPDVAFDWTWHSMASWCFYFGIPLSQNQHSSLRKLAYPDGGFHLLFSTKVFPRIEKKLTGILDARYEERQRKLCDQVVTHDRDF